MNRQKLIEKTNDEQILTAEEVAEYLRIHPYTVRRLARDGKIPGFRVGGQWRFEEKEIKSLQKVKRS